MSDKNTISSSLKKRIKEDQKALSELQNMRMQIKKQNESDFERSKKETSNIKKSICQSTKNTLDSIKKQLRSRHELSGQPSSYYIPLSSQNKGTNKVSPPTLTAQPSNLNSVPKLNKSTSCQKHPDPQSRTAPRVLEVMEVIEIPPLNISTCSPILEVKTKLMTMSKPLNYCGDMAYKSVRVDEEGRSMFKNRIDQYMQTDPELEFEQNKYLKTRPSTNSNIRRHKVRKDTPIPPQPLYHTPTTTGMIDSRTNKPSHSFTDIHSDNTRKNKNLEFIKPRKLFSDSFDPENINLKNNVDDRKDILQDNLNKSTNEKINQINEHARRVKDILEQQVKVVDSIKSKVNNSEKELCKKNNSDAGASNKNRDHNIQKDGVSIKLLEGKEDCKDTSSSYSLDIDTGSEMLMDEIDWDENVSGDSSEDIDARSEGRKPVEVSSVEIIQTLKDIKQLLKINLRNRDKNLRVTSVDKDPTYLNYEAQSGVDDNANQHNITKSSSMRQSKLFRHILFNLSFIKKSIVDISKGKKFNKDSGYLFNKESIVNVEVDGVIDQEQLFLGNCEDDKENLCLSNAIVDDCESDSRKLLKTTSNNNILEKSVAKDNEVKLGNSVHTSMESIQKLVRSEGLEMELSKSQEDKKEILPHFKQILPIEHEIESLLDHRDEELLSADLTNENVSFDSNDWKDIIDDEPLDESDREKEAVQTPSFFPKYIPTNNSGAQGDVEAIAIDQEDTSKVDSHSQKPQPDKHALQVEHNYGDVIANLTKECDDFFGSDKEEDLSDRDAKEEFEMQGYGRYGNASVIYEEPSITNMYEEWVSSRRQPVAMTPCTQETMDQLRTNIYNRFCDVSNAEACCANTYYESPFRGFAQQQRNIQGFTQQQRNIQSFTQQQHDNPTVYSRQPTAEDYFAREMALESENEPTYDTFENIIRQTYPPRQQYLADSLMEHSFPSFINDGDEVFRPLYQQGYEYSPQDMIDESNNYMLSWNIRNADDALNNISDLEMFDSSQEEDVLEIQINRHSETMLQDLLQFYKEAPKQLLLARLHVNFLGEPGVDGGALSKEYFQLVFRQLTDLMINSRSVFEGERGHLLPAVDHVLCEMQVYWFIGVLSAQALFNSCRGFSCLADPVRLFVMSGGRISQIPKLVEDVSDEDISDLELRSLVKKLRTTDELTTEEERLLKERLEISGFSFVFGRNTRLMALKHLVQYHIFDSRLPSLLSMAEGLWDMGNLHFNMDPDGRLLFPREEKIDVDSFFSALNFVCDSNIFESRSILVFFRMYCAELADQKIDGLGLSDLLRFFTGEPYVKSGLRVRVSSNDCPSEMPMAHTCDSQLILPAWRGQTYESFKSAFTKALKFASFGFGFA